MSLTLASSTSDTMEASDISIPLKESIELEDLGFEIIDRNGGPSQASAPTALAVRPQPRARARPMSNRRESTPISSRTNRASTPSSSVSKRKAEEKRILPVRMRGLGGSSGTGSNVTGKDVEDMIYQCFIRTLNASKQPAEDLPICLTMHSYTTISTSLNPRAAPEPAWWTGPPPTSSRMSLSPVAVRKPIMLPDTSPVKKRRTSGLALGDATELINGRKRVVMPGFRKATEEDDVIPNEKRKTRGATGTTEVEDSTDAHYQSLHLRYERYESRARLAERQKMEHGRYKLNIRIEYLEGLNDEVWEGAVMRMMQRGQRVRQAEEEQQQQLNGRDDGPSQAGSSSGNRMEAKSLEVIQAEQEERAYMTIMQAGADLLKVLTVPGLKRELIREGKELLARYDHILTKPKTLDKPVQAPPPPPPPARKPEKRNMSRSMSTESTMTPPPSESEDEVIFVKQPSPPARQESTSSEFEDPAEAAKPASKRSKKAGDTLPTPSRPSRTSTRAPHQTPLPVDANLIYVEPYYPPTTESGKPALIEAAEKRLIAIQNVEKAREIQARLKLMSKPGATGENTRTERRSRNETMLPLGVPPPGMLGWRSDFDLDGEFWLAMLTERGYGNAIDPPEFEPFEASVLPGIPTQIVAELPNDMIELGNAVADDTRIDLTYDAREGMNMDVDVEDHVEAEIDRVV